MSKEWESFSEVSVDIPSTESAAMISSQDQGDMEDDTTALLPGATDSKPKNQLPSVFSLEFYRRCWDVTTNEVRLRVKSACYPRGDFISALHGKPDLYGPFWVSVTLCFSTAICGNLANFIQNQGDPLYKYTPEFERVTSAASAIFGYAFIFPFFISLVLYYSKIMCGFSTVELLTSYGYSLSIFVPISFAWMIPSEFIRWVLVIIGAVISGSVVCLPIWQGLKEVMSNKKIAYGIIAIAVGANVALAVGFKMYFFNAPLQSSDGIPISPPVSHADQVIAEMEKHSEPEIPGEIPVVDSYEQPEVEAQVKDIAPPAEETADEPAEEPVEDREERDQPIPDSAEENSDVKEEPVEVEPVPAEPDSENPEEPESDEGPSEEEQKVIQVLKELPRANSPPIPQPAEPEDNSEVVVPVGDQPVEAANPPIPEDNPIVQNSEPEQAKQIILPRVG